MMGLHGRRRRQVGLASVGIGLGSKVKMGLRSRKCHDDVALYPFVSLCHGDTGLRSRWVFEYSLSVLPLYLSVSPLTFLSFFPSFFAFSVWVWTAES